MLKIFVSHVVICADFIPYSKLFLKYLVIFSKATRVCKIVHCAAVSVLSKSGIWDNDTLLQYCYYAISSRVYDIQAAKQTHCYKGAVSEDGTLIKVCISLFLLYIPRTTSLCACASVSFYNACQKSWNTDINFQGQNQSSPSPPRNNVGLLSNGLGF